MTVCIAALCDRGKGCILASDQMLTIHYTMPYEYENEEFDKICQLSEKPEVYCLTAGNAIFASEITSNTKREIVGIKRS